MARSTIFLAHAGPSQMRLRVAHIASFIAAAVVAAGAGVAPSAAQVPDSSLVGDCAPATAEAYLDVNNVRAKILNNGNLFWNGGPNVYEVPKGEGVDAIFAAGLWMAGMVDGDLRAAGSTYGPFEFWPGPIPDDGSAPTDCSAYDRFWQLNYEEDILHRHADDPPTDAVRAWPVELGAPFVNVNDEAGYQPDDGDRPEMLGDQTVWWVMNDLGNVHRRSNANPLGVEVRGTAFALDAPAAGGKSTFYRYQITNRNDVSITDFFLGLFVDTDLGAPFDDYIGTDTTLGMIYTYNADDEDEGYYGKAPPALGFSLITTSHEPKSDFPRFSPQTVPGFNFSIYECRCPANRVTFDSAREMYNQLQARMHTGEPQIVGGLGVGFDSQPSNFVLPGDPVTGTFWSELNASNSGQPNVTFDRTMLGSFGPIDIAAGETFETTLAIVWSRGSSNLDSITHLRNDMRGIRNYADDLLTPREIVYDPPLQVPEQVPFFASIYPNPATDEAMIRLGLPQSMDVRIEVFDALGRRITGVTDGRLEAGERRFDLLVTDWPPGVYLVRMQLDHITETRRLVVVN